VPRRRRWRESAHGRIAGVESGGRVGAAAVMI
jgi:hypothetical protein